MKLGLERIDDILVVTVPGRTLDIVHSDGFKRAIYPILAEEKKAILDITKLDFVDSSGLGAFVACAKMLRAAGEDLRICGKTKQVRWLFGLVKMHSICELFDTKREALESLKSIGQDYESAGDTTKTKTNVRKIGFRKTNQ